MAVSTASMRFDAAVRDPIPLRPTPEFRPFTLIALLQIAPDPKNMPKARDRGHQTAGSRPAFVVA